MSYVEGKKLLKLRPKPQILILHRTTLVSCIRINQLLPQGLCQKWSYKGTPLHSRGSNTKFSGYETPLNEIINEFQVNSDA